MSLSFRNLDLENLTQNYLFLREILLHLDSEYRKIQKSLDSSIKSLDSLVCQSLVNLISRPIQVTLKPLEITLTLSRLSGLTYLCDVCGTYSERLRSLYNKDTNTLQGLTQESCIQAVVESIHSIYKRLSKYKKSQSIRVGLLLYRIIPLTVRFYIICNDQKDLDVLNIPLQNLTSVLVMSTTSVCVYQLQNSICRFPYSDTMKIRGTMINPIFYSYVGSDNPLISELREENPPIYVTTDSLDVADCPALLDITQQDLQIIKDQVHSYLQNLRTAVTEFQNLTYSTIEEFSDVVVSQLL